VLRLLLVEDNLVNQKVASVLLRNRGHEVSMASTGHEALQLYRDHRFDVVLMDMQLPDMDGFQAAAAIWGLGPAPPIIALTAHAMKGYREKCLGAGFAGYIAKPFRKQELFSSIESIGLPQGASHLSAPFKPEVFDVQKFTSRLQGDLEAAREVLEVFWDTSQRQIAGLREALAAGDGRRVGLEAHNLKGSAAELYAPRLARVAHSIEDAVRAKDLSSVGTLVEECDAILGAMRDELKRSGLLG
jgi:CheY-like chemotaxis protein